ncbi:uncharacterized protein LOC126681679 [Mercurialis annua]|uniref:uncharacterized protein LOC126681679 n=1 Tax=Mercurialis annua TaxID=3986 RepID=UPI00215FC4B7|nr:uncharacterized protein LOC126681679 [Mercurialis annua]
MSTQTPATETQISRTATENHSVQITTIRLYGDNFLRWSQSVCMYIKGRGKIVYITGDTERPDMKDSTFPIWDAENSMVMTWLVNSMIEEISANYMCYSTAKDLRDNVSQMYSDLGNQSQVYELTLRLGEISQGEESVTKYFNSIKRIWQDLDLINDYEWNPLPAIGEVFAEVRREESRRHVMLGKKTANITGSTDSYALAIPEVHVSHKNSYNQHGVDGKSHLQCDYCGKPRHTRETCFILKRRSSNGKGFRATDRSSEQGNHISQTANEAETCPFSKEQLDHL